MNESRASPEFKRALEAYDRGVAEGRRDTSPGGVLRGVLQAAADSNYPLGGLLRTLFEDGYSLVVLPYLQRGQ